MRFIRWLMKKIPRHPEYIQWPNGLIAVCPCCGYNLTLKKYDADCPFCEQRLRRRNEY